MEAFVQHLEHELLRSVWAGPARHFSSNRHRFTFRPLAPFLQRCGHNGEEEVAEEEEGGEDKGDSGEGGPSAAAATAAVSPKRRAQQEQQRRRWGRRELLEAVLTVGPPVRGGRPVAEAGGSKVGGWVRQIKCLPACLVFTFYLALL